MDDDEFQEAVLDRSNRISRRLLYPSNIDEYNNILGTTKGRRNLMRDKGIILYLNDVVHDDED